MVRFVKVGKYQLYSNRSRVMNSSLLYIIHYIVYNNNAPWSRSLWCNHFLIGSVEDRSSCDDWGLLIIGRILIFHTSVWIVAFGPWPLRCCFLENSDFHSKMLPLEPNWILIPWKFPLCMMFLSTLSMIGLSFVEFNSTWTFLIDSSKTSMQGPIQWCDVLKAYLSWASSVPLVTLLCLQFY